MVAPGKTATGSADWRASGLIYVALSGYVGAPVPGGRPQRRARRRARQRCRVAAPLLIQERRNSAIQHTAKHTAMSASQRYCSARAIKQVQALAGLSWSALKLRHNSSSSTSSRACACCLASAWAWASTSIRAAYSLLACRSACCVAMRCAASATLARSSLSHAARSCCAGSLFGPVRGSGSELTGRFICGMRCDGRRSPALLAAWCSLTAAPFTAWASASSRCDHPAVSCRSSSGCRCGSASGWAYLRRCSSAAAFPAASLVVRVSADHCSYRVLSASRCWRSAASWTARAVALAAPG